MKRNLLIGMVLFMIGGLTTDRSDAAEEIKTPEKLKSAAANTWVVLNSSKKDPRMSVLLFWSPEIGRVVRTGGGLARRAKKYAAHHTREFDLTAGTWQDARPKEGANGALLMGTGNRYNMRAHVPSEGKFYVRANAGRKEPKLLYTYDPAARTWAKVEAPPLEFDGRWGALGYDPVNNELVLSGGLGSHGRPTWLFDLKTKTWRRHAPTDEGMIALNRAASDLTWKATELVGRAANRFTIAETAEEAKEDLGARAGGLSSELKALAEKAKTAKIAANHAEAVKHAAILLGKLGTDYAALKDELGGKITPELLGSLRAAKRRVLMAQYALSPEPVARGLSPLAYDPVGKRLVLFGGDRLDSTLSDTWIYDCKTRTWSQRFPKKVPAPRAGHVLDWLPKAGKIVLAGGYSRRALVQDIWTYDPAANAWALLKSVPLKETGRHRPPVSPGCPMAAYDQPLAGTVCPGDILVAQAPSRSADTLHACRVEASATDTAGITEYGVAPGTITFHRQEPAVWEKVAAPDRAKTKAFLAGLKPNVWTEFKHARYAPGARNRWGTTAYDPERKQFLFWGGGHATSMQNEVGHFSIRGGCWTVSYPPDHPREASAYMSWGGTTFTRRPAMPWAHAYQAYEYSSGGKMCLLASTYDVRAREWQEPAKGLKSKGLMKSMVEYTPHGAVCLSEAGLFKYDSAKNEWTALPWKGPAFGRAWCDGHALCYDYKRDCLWAANASIFKYDFKTGTATKLSVKVPLVMRRGKKVFALYREQVHLPDDDLILIMRPFKGPDGKLAQVAWDPESHKYYWVKLPYTDGKSHSHSWSSAIAYDPDFKLVFMNHSRGRKVWVLKFDRKTADLQEIKAPAPSK